MFKRVIGLVGALGMAAVVGCGGGDTSGEGGAGSGTTAATGNNTTSSGNNTTSSGNNTTTSGGTSFECCINDSHFTCPSQSAVDKCADFSNPDPSSCQADAKSCGGSTTSGNPATTSGGPATTTGSGGDDTGNDCQLNSDCSHNVCLFKPGADFGYCSKTCMSFTECPTFWDCTEIANGSTTYCVQN